MEHSGVEKGNTSSKIAKAIPDGFERHAASFPQRRIDNEARIGREKAQKKSAYKKKTMVKYQEGGGALPSCSSSFARSNLNFVISNERSFELQQLED